MMQAIDISLKFIEMSVGERHTSVIETPYFLPVAFKRSLILLISVTKLPKSAGIPPRSGATGLSDMKCQLLAMPRSVIIRTIPSQGQSHQNRTSA